MCSQNSSMAEHTKEQDPHSHCSPRFSLRGPFPEGGMTFTLREEEGSHSCRGSTPVQLGVTAGQAACPEPAGASQQGRRARPQAPERPAVPTKGQH